MLFIQHSDQGLRDVARFPHFRVTAHGHKGLKRDEDQSCTLLVAIQELGPHAEKQESETKQVRRPDQIWKKGVNASMHCSA